MTSYNYPAGNVYRTGAQGQAVGATRATSGTTSQRQVTGTSKPITVKAVQQPRDKSK